MNREEILKQIMALPEKSRLLVGFNEMAKDLEGILKDDEVIEGVAAAYEKNITHLVKNGKMMRSFMAITNKNVYLLSRGRMILNNVSLMNKTIVIPRNQILKINRKELPAVLKILYDAEVDIMTDTEQYEIYMGAGFEKYLPQSFLSKITTEHVLEKVVSEKKCPNCGQEVAAEANFCKRCGTAIPKEEEKKKVCVQCGYELSEKNKFCPNCGAEVVEEVEQITACPNCGYAVEKGVKFCLDCGTSLLKIEK